MTWQSDIFHSVTQRGYTQDSLTDEQFLARQAMKTCEELLEYLQCFSFENGPYGVVRALESVVMQSKRYFQRPETIGLVRVNRECAKSELADLLVTLGMAGEILKCDVLAEASRKAKGDVKRGVRNGH